MRKTLYCDVGEEKYSDTRRERIQTVNDTD